jgi:uncharacterized protein DUF4131
VLRPPRRPLLWAAFAYGARIVGGSQAWRPDSWWVVAGVGFVGEGTYFARRWVWLGFSLGALFFIGALGIQLRSEEKVPGMEIGAFADGDETMVTAHVTRQGEIRSAGFGDWRESIDLETEEVGAGESARAIRTGLRLGIYSKESDPEYEEDGETAPMRVFRYGERLRFPAKLRMPRNFRSPGAFDYRGYLPDNGIVVLGSAKAASVEVLPGFVGTRIEQWRDRVHHSIVRKIHALWGARRMLR